MITKEDVEKFLGNFYVKVKIFGIRFRDDRGKNRNTLFDLENSPQLREKVVMSLKWNDYSEDPIIDELNNYGECRYSAKMSTELKFTSRFQWGNPIHILSAFRFIQQSIQCLTHLKTIDYAQNRTC